MSIVLNGTTGVTTPDVTSDGLTVDSTTLVVDETNSRVGIGTSSPAEKLSVSGRVFVSGSGYITNPTGLVLGQYASNDVYIQKPSGANLSFWDSTTNAEVTIDANGNLLVGQTSGIARQEISFPVSSVIGFRFNMTDTTYNNAVMEFRTSAATRVGYIFCNGSSTSYNTSSDYRLKEDWVAVADASTRVNALKPVNFAWKADGSRVDGFLAHELAEVVPEAVTGEKDATEMVDVYDEDGNVTGQEERPVYQGIDQSKLVPLLTAALQEALAEINALKARLDAANL